VIFNFVGVVVDNKVNKNGQCAAAGTKANCMLSFIHRGTTDKYGDVIIPLYAALVRPLLENDVQFWSLSRSNIGEFSIRSQ